jgi:hypothetical protein
VSEKGTGGAAFPRSVDGVGGMTLRDYFAAQYIAGRGGYGAAHVYELAVEAYSVADAMLEARRK